MLAVGFERSIIRTLNSSIVHNGVREDDELRLELFQERARTLKLKRTRYIISCAHKFNIDYQKASLDLPVFDLRAQSFELRLIPHQEDFSYSDKSRYLLKSMNEAPFKLNGSACFEAFIERGDVVEIGFNRLRFCSAHSLINLVERESLLSEDIIKSRLNVVIEGETGTGKSTLAKKIHQESARGGEFVHLNLAAFAPSLIESELFGHVKGAFTGAHQEKRGAIVQAHRGTLFLDEIDSLSLELQTKLLLFLDSQEVRAVGASSNVKVDVRLVFASGTLLKILLEQSKIRKDFYYRLSSGINVELKNLRSEPERIKKLCRDWQEEHCVVLGNELMDFYMRCSWPGNIRQLHSHLNKKKVLAGGKKIVLTDDDYDLLHDHQALLGKQVQSFRTLEEIKQDYCYAIFIKVEKNSKRACEILGISPNTLKAMIEARSRRDD